MIQFQLDETNAEFFQYGLDNDDKWDSLCNKTFLVTGAGSGYGKAIATALEASGATVYSLGRTLSKLTIGIPLECDMTNKNQLQSTVEQLPNLDGVISCAGIGAGDSVLSEIDDNRWDDMFNIHVKAQWNLFQLTKDKMNDMRYIFFTSGMAGKIQHEYGLYSVVKASLNALVINLANEASFDNQDKIVSINGVNPGVAKTQMRPESNISPFGICSLILNLLTTEYNIPNGKFFKKEGFSYNFLSAEEYKKELI